jgi:tetratricopeptide (TPR) repeat protein
LAAAAVLLVGVTMAATWRGRDFETQRPLASTDIVVVANFENRTDEPGLGIALAYATSEALRSTGRIQVAERARVEDTLALMGKAVETAIEEGLAREVAIRDGGIRAVAVGSIELSNPGYHLQLLIRDPSSGAVLKRAEGTARDRDALLAEVRDLARVVSAAPLPDRHVADPALEPVTTASLDALRLYTESFYAGGRSQWPAARDLAAEAIAKDPAFPSAQIWMAWCLRNTGGPPSEYMPYAARAMELSDQVQPWERLWIRASYFTFAGADEDAIGAYQALTRLRPDHPWSIGNLMTLWQRLGQRETAVALLPPAADRRPHDFLTNAYAADVLAIWNKDVAGAREYAKRAAALAPRDPRDGRLAGYTTWVSELKYFESWVNGDLQPAGRHVADTMSGEMSGGERMQDARLKSAGLFALTLGQLRNARTLFLRMSNSRLSQRADYLARVAFESDAPDEARRQLRELIASSPTQAGRQVGTQMAWLGLRKETEQILRNMGQAPGQARAGIAGTAKLAAGDAKAAIPLLAESIAWARASGHHAFFLHCELLAQAYVAEQRTSEAIEVLEAAGRDMARAYPGYADQYGSSGYLWLRTQAALLPLYHNAKREIDEAQLRSMLVSFLRLSDDDHPIRRQLEASAREH